MNAFFSNFDQAIDSLWLIFGFPVLIGLGAYFSYRFRFVQIRKLPEIWKLFCSYATQEKSDARGSSPVQLFFAAIGGCIGIGNVVGVCTAVQIGGPGAVFWVWVTAFFGMMVKYSEVFLGVRYRKPNNRHGYDGGPAYYLQKAFTSSWVPILAALFLCVYGVEIYIFHVVVDSFVNNWDVSRVATVAILLTAVIYGACGGLKRIGQIAAVVVPMFIVCFLALCLFVLAQNLTELPGMFATILRSAFSGHAAVGGFAGSTAMMAIAQGVSWGCYTGDIGIGYASVIHSETSEKQPGRQASLAILGIFLDTLVVCTMSLTVILVTGTWSAGIDPVMMVQAGLSEYIPGLPIFMPILFGLLGYSTLIAFLGVGLKNADFLGGERGRRLYLAYAIVALVVFAFSDPTNAAILMRATGCGLLFLNVIGFYRLRNEINIDTLENP